MDRVITAFAVFGRWPRKLTAGEIKHILRVIAIDYRHRLVVIQYRSRALFIAEIHPSPRRTYTRCRRQIISLYRRYKIIQRY